ncbi:hypothetical protein [Roseiconus lacunae]|uniref:hypothetical protein n=1 Tax=Roseiconus lacunae TaxID=2605694 RepID=UPI001E333757|nr:hypothetical protein [Roseiconus lacunae]
MNPFCKSRRHLSVQSLEGRKLLASLISQLPPIRVAMNETVMIVDQSGRTEELSGATFQGLKELEQLHEIAKETAPANVESLTDLIWQQAITRPSHNTNSTPDLRQATDLAAAGFQVVGDDPFGTPLSFSYPTESVRTSSDVVNELQTLDPVEPNLPSVSSSLETSSGDLVDSAWDDFNGIPSDVDSNAPEDDQLQSDVPSASVVDNSADVAAVMNPTIPTTNQHDLSRSGSGKPDSHAELIGLDLDADAWPNRHTVSNAQEDVSMHVIEHGISTVTTADAAPAVAMHWLSLAGVNLLESSPAPTESSQIPSEFNSFGIVQLISGQQVTVESKANWPIIKAFSVEAEPTMRGFESFTLRWQWSLYSVAAVVLAGYLYRSHVLPQKCETDRRDLSLFR